MEHSKKARIFQNGGSQAVRLPAEFRFEGDEVYIRRDEFTGEVILSSKPVRDVWKRYIAFRDALDIPEAELADYLSERPMNRPIVHRSVFEDEE